MALSNIFNETRREITETLVGVAVVAVSIAITVPLDWLFANWFQSITPFAHGKPDPVLWWFGIVIGPILAVAMVGISGLALEIFHSLGEDWCDRLEDFGIRLRPRR